MMPLHNTIPAVDVHPSVEQRKIRCISTNVHQTSIEIEALSYRKIPQHM
jgi:hypothetical protein